MARKVIRERTVVKQKTEFSKKMVLFMAFIFLGCIIASYVLSYFDKNPVEGLSIALSASFTGALGGYFAKSFLEKNSRNKYKVDEFGERRKENENQLDSEIVEP